MSPPQPKASSASAPAQAAASAAPGRTWARRGAAWLRALRVGDSAQGDRVVDHSTVVHLLLDHTKLENTVRYLGIEVDDALEMAEQTDI